MKFPVDFEEKAKQAKQASGGYPVQISSADLMANFHFAALEAKASVQGSPQPFSTTQENLGGTKTTRVLTFNPPPPTDGRTYVFGFSGGSFAWIATEEC
jgi:hypothetical protein